jgi:DNA (cytosine-5)-methyltransferase 1
MKRRPHEYGIKAIEMFSGIGGFRRALELESVPTVWANDIEPLACAIYRKNFGDSILVEGDVNNHLDSIPSHDLLTAGFPCQPFSQAGKKLGIACEDQGTLFQSIAAVLRKHTPRFFVLENVKRLLSMDGGYHFRRILEELTGTGYLVEWRLLNSKNFGLAQNRERLFLVGTRSSPPETIAEILEKQSTLLTSADVKAWPSWRMNDSITTMEDLGTFTDKFATWGIALNGKVMTLRVPELGNVSAPIRLKEIVQEDVDSSFDMTEKTLEWISKNTPVGEFINGVEIISNQEGGRRMGYTIFGINGIAPTVTASTSRHYERYLINDRYRRLTNVEYARLQGFPDDWGDPASPYDQYRLFGNAVPPPMAKWVISRLGEQNVSLHHFSSETLFSRHPTATAA